jgi:hypothetical protein
VPPPEPKPAKLRASVGPLAALGWAPSTSIGLAALFGVRWETLSLNVEASGTFPAARTVDIAGASVTVSASLLSLAFAPCVHRSVVAACAIGLVGALEGTASSRDTTAYAAAGARVEAEIPLGGAWLLRPHLGGLATITRTSLQVSGQTAWETPPLSGTLGLAILTYF